MGCAGLHPSVGELPDFADFSPENFRVDAPIGFSVGVRGERHTVRVFGAITSPEAGGPKGLTFRDDTVFFFGLWWSLDF